MPKKIVLQAGHINCQFNSIVSLRNSSGAPGEQELTLRITNRVSTILRDKGFQVVQTDANGNSDPVVTGTDWDMFLAIHGDSDTAGDQGGGMVGVLDPKVDYVASESGRIQQAIRSEYFKHAEIVDKNYTTAAITGYYMWNYLTLKTPCVLLELGQVQDPHDKVLLADTERIANAVARGVCAAFGVVFDVIVAPPPTPSELEAVKAQLAQAKIDLTNAQKTYETNLANIKADCQKKLDQINAGLVIIQNILPGLITLTKPS